MLPSVASRLATGLTEAAMWQWFFQTFIVMYLYLANVLTTPLSTYVKTTIDAQFVANHMPVFTSVSLTPVVMICFFVVIIFQLHVATYSLSNDTEPYSPAAAVLSKRSLSSIDTLLRRAWIRDAIFYSAVHLIFATFGGVRDVYFYATLIGLTLVMCMLFFMSEQRSTDNQSGVNIKARIRLAAVGVAIFVAIWFILISCILLNNSLFPSVIFIIGSLFALFFLGIRLFLSVGRSISIDGPSRDIEVFNKLTWADTILSKTLIQIIVIILFHYL